LRADGTGVASEGQAVGIETLNADAEVESPEGVSDGASEAISVGIDGSAEAVLEA
jgi:hypothetical protein